MNILREKLKMFIMSNKNITPIDGDLKDDNISILNSYLFSYSGKDILPSVIHSSFSTVSVPIPNGAKKVTFYTDREKGFTIDGYDIGYGVSETSILDENDYANILGLNTSDTTSFNIDLRLNSKSKYIILSVFSKNIDLSIYKFTFN